MFYAKEEAVSGVLNREQIEEEIRELDELMKRNDYIGVKIAMGRATREEYAEQIANSEQWAQRKSELLILLGDIEKPEEEQPEGTEGEQPEGTDEEEPEGTEGEEPEGTDEEEPGETDEEQPEENEEQTEEQLTNEEQPESEEQTEVQAEV